jgi:DNA-binding response OmpR family regulator
MEKPTVLIVDDERMLSMLVSHILEDEGFEVVRAENGRIALHLVEEQPPNLILLDLIMPDMDGRTFYHECRSAGCDCPVVILSSEGARAAQRELGAQGFIEKPFDPDELIDTVKDVLAA